MTDPETTPVLVGVAHVDQRVPTPSEAKEPLALMIDASRRAAEDAGSRALLDAVTSVRVERGLWRYGDPGKAVAERLGLGGVETAITPFGGNFVQTLVNRTALDIQAGRHEAVLLTGAECGYSQAKARKTGEKPRWSEAPGEPAWIGEEVPMVSELEQDRGIRQPIQFYPIFENALRYHRGESIAAHLERISELWAGFSRVAADNPYAWIRQPLSAEEIRTPSARNRPVSFPYPKLMNSNNSVDQGAALIMCSLAAARRLGVPEERVIYLHSGTDAHDTYYVSNRENFHSSPAIRVAGRRVLELAGVRPEELGYRDVYSCFPVAVQVAAEEIGLDLQQPQTVTGGLTFAGGPLNNYVMHAIARMAELLRDDPGAKGLITANGGFLTKHAFGVYSTEPPAQPFRHEDVQEEVDRFPTREADGAFSGRGTTEAYTVMYGAQGPAVAHVSVLTPAGARTWANTRDPEIMDAMVREEFCGHPVTVTAEGDAAF